jgi:hypothetical protein
MASLMAGSRHMSTEVVWINDHTIRLFFSWKTLVGVQFEHHPPVFTNEEFSRSTNRHVRHLAFTRGGMIIDKDLFRGYAKLFAPGYKLDR